MRARMADIAKQAQVSEATVSRVINSETNVREETRARVSASIKALRYSPNLAARSLASADTVHIGILYANSTAAYLSELLLGSLEQSSLSGCQLVLEHCEDLESERKAVQRLIAGGVDGVILPAPLGDSEDALKTVIDADTALGPRIYPSQAAVSQTSATAASTSCWSTRRTPSAPASRAPSAWSARRSARSSRRATAACWSRASRRTSTACSRRSTSPSTATARSSSSAARCAAT